MQIEIIFQYLAILKIQRLANLELSSFDCRALFLPYLFEICIFPEDKENSNMQQRAEYQKKKTKKLEKQNIWFFRSNVTSIIIMSYG